MKEKLKEKYNYMRLLQLYANKIDKLEEMDKFLQI